METRMQKWGDSLALRIPKSISGQMQLDKYHRTPSPIGLLENGVCA